MIVCSGDLATTGLSHDLDAAVRYFTEGIAEFGSIGTNIYPGMLSSKKSVLLMPGNHDRYGKKGIPAGNSSFRLKFGGRWESRGVANVEYSSASKASDRLVFVAADFGLKSMQDAKKVGIYPKRITCLGQGRSYDEVISNLCNVTEQARKKYPTAAIVWTIHFPIAEIADKRLQLIDSEKIILAAKEVGINVVLGGHIHESSWKNCDGIHNLIAGSSSAVDVSSAHEMHLLTFNIEQTTIVGLSRTDLVWDRGMFVLGKSVQVL
jgi:hypothetical protein